MASAAEASKHGPSRPGLLLLEHLNLNVKSRATSLAFYEAMGCVRDERRSMDTTLHTNCGPLTQFHTPSPDIDAYAAEVGPQKWRGEIEILYSDIEEVQAAVERLQRLSGTCEFEGSPFSVGAVSVEGAVAHAAVMGPYGNHFLLRTAAEEQRRALGPESGQRPGSEPSRCVGLGRLTLHVPPGTAGRAAEFYSQVLGFDTCELEPGSWAIRAGPGGTSQSLLLKETPGESGKEVGEHLAIYIGDYSGCFERLQQRGLIFVNPRFVKLDRSTTLEEAFNYATFRFKDIVDISTGEKLFELEHEVRSVAHSSCPFHPEALATSALTSC